MNVYASTFPARCRASTPSPRSRIFWRAATRLSSRRSARPASSSRIPNVGLFAQDEWRPRRGLTINLGLRYDAQVLPDPVETDANNFAPRAGLAFSPDFLGRDRRTVVRASYGLYFDRLPLRATSNALQRDGSKYRVAVLPAGVAGAPAFPSTLGAFPEGLLVSITTIDPRIRSAYSQQASLQVERELSGAMSLAVGYLHVRSEHIILSRNVNVPRFPASAGVFESRPA